MTDMINEQEVENDTEEVAEATEDTEQNENAEVSDEPVVPDRVVVFEEALEAILFAAGHPISYATLARVFDMTPAKVKDKVFEYAVRYNGQDIPRGVMLLTFGDTCQLCTKQYYLAEIRDALGIRKSGTLSTSSMEALAIIAYNQPVTRVFVDTLRRVDSSYAMNNLLDRGLIESKGRLDAPGRPMLYGTTQDFLRCFGLKDLASLPKTGEELAEVFNNAKLAEAGSEGSEEENDEAPQIEMELDDAVGTEDATETDIDNDDLLDEPSADDYAANHEDI